MARHHLKVVTEAAEAPDRDQPARADQGYRPAPHLAQLGRARGRARHGVSTPGASRANPPEHEANLVFTRMLAGPMDFTPGILSLEGPRPGRSSRPRPSSSRSMSSSTARSRWRRTCSRITRQPAALPVHQGRAGRLGGDAWCSTARSATSSPSRARTADSENWYLGAVTDEKGGELERRRSTFLTPGRRYRAQIYRDGAECRLSRPAPQDDRHRGARR